jgi:hypothetical protein
MVSDLSLNLWYSFVAELEAHVSQNRIYGLTCFTSELYYQTPYPERAQNL